MPRRWAPPPHASAQYRESWRQKTIQLFLNKEVKNNLFDYVMYLSDCIKVYKEASIWGAVWNQKKLMRNTCFFNLVSPNYVRFGPKNTYKLSQKFPIFGHNLRVLFFQTASQTSTVTLHD